MNISDFLYQASHANNITDTGQFQDKTYFLVKLYVIYKIFGRELDLE